MNDEEFELIETDPCELEPKITFWDESIDETA
jgi:hypothetical protein